LKKIINKTEDIVRDMLEGLAVTTPQIELIPKYKIVKRAQIDSDKVCLISGGGSGHEPTHAGFVGKGMLDAAVCGDIFASPSQIQVYQAIRAVAGEKGVLLIIKNYSGDVMNFKNAARMAQEDGIFVDYVRVEDDIAVEDSLYTVGRRGVAGTVFVHKIAGAAAEQGKSLEEVKRIAEKTAANVGSLGFALTSCTVPANGVPTFSLDNDEMEFGVGIHGEPGIHREKIVSADVLAERITDTIAKELQIEGSGTRVAVMINGFGASPMMELYILGNYVTGALFAKNVMIAREFVGNYMTSIDMVGASVSILKLDDELEALLNEPADTEGMKVVGKLPDLKPIVFDYGISASSEKDPDIRIPAEWAKIGKAISYQNIVFIVDALSNCIIRNEQAFCELDSHAGDGDFGMSVSKGFRRLKHEWNAIVKDAPDDIGRFLGASSLVIMEHCGGASGPIWGSAFRAAGKAAEGKNELTIPEFAAMMQAAIKEIQATGKRSFGRGAVIGDKTLIDALIPTADVWSAAGPEEEIISVFAKGAQAAVDGAEMTRNIVARMGRAGAVGERSLGYPDAGAYALGVIFMEIAEMLQ
jgi:dihydroxyacetone kinase